MSSTFRASTALARPIARTEPAHPAAAPRSIPSGPALRPLAEILRATQVPEAHSATGSAVAADLERTRGLGSGQRVDPRAPALAEAVLRAAVEFVAGHRPARQLQAVLRPEVMAYLSRLQTTAGMLRPRMRAVRSQQPVPGALEATGVVLLRTGVRAVFARFESPHAARSSAGRSWQCVDLHLPLTQGDLAAARRPR